MQGGFGASIADGEPLSFALGCLLAACRARLAAPDRRLALASYALAVGLILPLAAVLAVDAIVGFPYLDFAQDNVVGILAVGGASSTLLDNGNRAAASSLLMVVFFWPARVSSSRGPYSIVIGCVFQPPSALPGQRH